ncbi:MAG TPA: radical SAM protein [Acetivibrio sp.]|uniref:radical SAM/SPASM domain-containing protein n=1 Tax=Acetivibrio sp. TaxID=1872092 RepID=UPI002C2522B6|nr:radical SAM protein [Acetivibrio sp.]HOM03221.1 radical SAM protein [Acetivibrio sp.]
MDININIINIVTLVKMAVNPSLVKKAWQIHKVLSENKEYKLKNFIGSIHNAFKNERILQHQNTFVISSFIPPINTKAFNSLFDGIPGSGGNVFENLAKGKRKFPVWMNIDVTSRYPNNRDSNDGNGSFEGQKNLFKDMEKEILISLINEIQDMGVGIVGLTGGEPLLRDDLEQIIEKIDDRSVSYVYSTGYGLTSQRARDLKSAGLYGTVIDIQSMSESEHNEIMGFNGAYHYALNAIENSKKAELYTVSRTFCSKKLLKEGNIREFIKFLGESGVDEVRLMEPKPFGKSGIINREELLTDDERRELIELHILCNKDASLPKVSVCSYFESQGMFGCGAAGYYSFIDGHGNLYPCDYIPFNFGNVFETPIKALWKKMYRAFEEPIGHCCSQIYFNQMEDGEFQQYPQRVKTLPENCKICTGQVAPGFYKILNGEKI